MHSAAVEPPDGDLVQRSRQGDPEAFGELVRRYQAGVFNVCYRLLGERAAAEDAAQEAFLRAFERLGTYDAARPFGPWMRRVAANLCLNQLERRVLRTHPLEDELDSAAEPAAADPARLAEAAQSADALRAALAALPPRYRAVIELRHFQDLSYTAIAAALGRPLSDVKSDLFRARKLLAERLRQTETRYG